MFILSKLKCNHSLKKETLSDFIHRSKKLYCLIMVFKYLFGFMPESLKEREREKKCE